MTKRSFEWVIRQYTSMVFYRWWVDPAMHHDSHSSDMVIGTSYIIYTFLYSLLASEYCCDD